MTTTELSPFESLQQQIIQKRNENAASQSEVKTPTSNKEMDGSEGEGGSDGSFEAESKGKTFKFSKGEKNFEVDEDAEFEFLADKRPVKMTVKEMRDAAAGGVAVRNRMRQLAEEKRDLHDPYKEFSKNYREDPFNALKKVFNAVKKIDPSADFNEFISGLGKQAQTVAQMEPSDRKAYLLEKDLKEAQGRLTEAEQLQKMGELKAELAEQTGLPDEKIFHFGQEILKNPVLAATVKNEEDLIERIGELAEEVEMQKASHDALRKYKNSISPRDPLVFELSNLIKRNPDFNEKDLDDIAREVLGTVHKAHASQKLSRKQNKAWSGRANSDATPDFTRMKPKDALMYQILEKKKQQK